MALLLALGMLLAACATPAPTPPAAPPSAPATKPAPTPTALDAVIEGAKKEGEISLWVDHPFMEEKLWTRVEKEIADQFGVKLKMTYTSTETGAKTASKLLTEKKAGKTPDYDLVSIQLTNSLPLIPEGILSKVDWRSLITKDSNPDVVFDFEGATYLSFKSQGQNGYAYLVDKVSQSELPKGLWDFADPKWKGKIGMFNQGGPIARVVLMTANQVKGGVNEAKDILRKVVENKCFFDDSSALATRMKIGEVLMAITQDNIPLELKADGIKSEYQLMGPYNINETLAFIPGGCQHPNAAKLVGVYLGSPAGAKALWETTQTGTYLYKGNPYYDMIQQAKKDGRKIEYFARDKAALELTLSPDYVALQKECSAIIQGASGGASGKPSGKP